MRKKFLKKHLLLIMIGIVVLIAGVSVYVLWNKYKAETSTEESLVVGMPDTVIFAGALVDTNNRPLSNVDITLDPYIITSDSDGDFVLDGIEPGNYPLTFFKDEQQLVWRDGGDSIYLSGEAMAPQTFVLAPPSAATPTPTPTPTPADTTKPAVNLFFPSNNATISGNRLVVSADIADASGLTETSAYFGPKDGNNFTRIPMVARRKAFGFGAIYYTIDPAYDVSTRAEGDYQIYVKATDRAGNTTETAKITVRVTHPQGGGGCSRR